jgi:hypothetical protein
MIVTDNLWSLGHIACYRTIFHGLQFKQIFPSYTKSHFVHSLRTSMSLFDVSPFVKRSNSFIV